jgi:serine protease DegQ
MPPSIPATSGGALVDASGNLIGINSAIYSPNGGSLGIGFAIPVSTAKKIMEQIIQSGSVVRGWIGVAVQDLTPELLESFKLGDTKGVLIAEVVRGSPADKAGVKAGRYSAEHCRSSAIRLQRHAGNHLGIAAQQSCHA